MAHGNFLHLSAGTCSQIATGLLFWIASSNQLGAISCDMSDDDTACHISQIEAQEEGEIAASKVELVQLQRQFLPSSQSTQHHVRADKGQGHGSSELASNAISGHRSIAIGKLRDLVAASGNDLDGYDDLINYILGKVEDGLECREWVSTTTTTTTTTTLPACIEGAGRRRSSRISSYPSSTLPCACNSEMNIAQFGGGITKTQSSSDACDENRPVCVETFRVRWMETEISRSCNPSAIPQFDYVGKGYWQGYTQVKSGPLMQEDKNEETIDCEQCAQLCLLEESCTAWNLAVKTNSGNPVTDATCQGGSAEGKCYTYTRSFTSMEQALKSLKTKDADHCLAYKKQLIP